MKQFDQAVAESGIRGRWVTGEASPDAPVQLFCFPHAGGGPGFFGAWRRSLHPWLDVRSIHLPGRESRAREGLLTDIENVVPPVVDAVAKAVDRPFLLFGHSLGSIVAFETARQLESRGVRPMALVVSSRRAPDRQRRAARYETMTQAAFLGAVEGLNGTPVEVLEHEALVEMMLPILRADFVMNERYVRFPGRVLDAPIMAMAAAQDPEVPVAEMLDWRHETTGGFMLRVFEGDHFYLKSAPLPVWAAIRSLVQERGFNTAHTSEYPAR